MARCFLFKPDGIGDFFLSSGVIRLLAREFGEENLTIATLPVMESVVRGQFPRATFIPLPIRKRRIILNVFVANCIRCFSTWLTLLRSPHEVSISLRHMRDYLMNVLFYSLPSPLRLVCDNQLLGNRRPVRRWTEWAFTAVFRPVVLAYPPGEPSVGGGVPRELEANRRLVSRALGRDVAIAEIWPELRRVGESTLGESQDGSYWLCAPFANGGGKDYPGERWAELFRMLAGRENIPVLVLTGSREQRGRLEEFSRLISESWPEAAPRISIEHPSDLQKFIDLIAGADLVLTVDTAAAHAATAMDRPTVILYSGQQYGVFGPWVRSGRQRWIQPKAEDFGRPDWHRNLSPGQIAPVVSEVLQAP
ncbi:MAG: glycosyltransferase family 9 protein [Chthoniobacterales bacterium]